LVLSHPDCNGFTASWNADNCNNAIPAPYYVLYIKKSTAVNYTAYALGTTNFKDVNWLSPNFTYDVFVRSVACNGAVSANSNVDSIAVGGPGCRTEEESLTQTMTGAGNESIALYPNPANHEFFVDIARDAEDDAAVKIEIVNALGQVLQTNVSVMNGHANELVRLSDAVSSGVYFVRVYVDANVYTQRLVVSKD
jgi:hypothetical protein